MSHLYCKKVGDRLEPMKEDLQKFKLLFGALPHEAPYSRKVEEVIVHEGYTLDGELFINYTESNETYLYQMTIWTMT